MASTLSRADLSIGEYLAARRLRLLVLTGIALVFSALFIGLVLLNPIVSPITLVTWFLVIGIAWRPRIGLFTAFTLVQLFEAGGADPLMYPGYYLHGGLASTTGLTGVIANPLELLLLVTFGIWASQALARRRLDFRAGKLFWPMMVFFAFLVFGLLRGLMQGGDVNIALWESRFLFYIVICYVLATNTIRNFRDVGRLVTLGLVATTLFGVEGIYRKVALIDTGVLGVIGEFAWQHDDVIFLSAAILLSIALLVFGAPAWQRVLAPVVIFVCGFVLLASERRAGQIGLIVSFIAFTLVFLIVHRKAFFLLAVPLLLCLAVYLPLFWNNTSMIGQPARAIRSLYQPDPRDASSNLYRELEKINVRLTIRANPIAGVGFGRQFIFFVPLPDLSWWPFWHYEPHHNILWLWLKLGVGGFVVFWVLMGSALARAANCVKTLRIPEARVFAMLCIGGIISTLVFCYVDLGLVSGRVTIFLGTLLGTLAVLEDLAAERSASTAGAATVGSQASGPSAVGPPITGTPSGRPLSLAGSAGSR